MKMCPKTTEKGEGGEYFSLFYRIHHATAMTHHRKSSSEKLMGGVGDHGPKMGIRNEEAALQAKKAMGERVHISGRRGRRGRHQAESAAAYVRLSTENCCYCLI